MLTAHVLGRILSHVAPHDDLSMQWMDEIVPAIKIQFNRLGILNFVHLLIEQGSLNKEN